MPVEHIWEALRENYFYFQVFSSLEQVEDVLCQGLFELSAVVGLIYRAARPTRIYINWDGLALIAFYIGGMYVIYC